MNLLPAGLYFQNNDSNMILQENLKVVVVNSYTVLKGFLFSFAVNFNLYISVHSFISFLLCFSSSLASDLERDNWMYIIVIIYEWLGFLGFFFSILRLFDVWYVLKKHLWPIKWNLHIKYWFKPRKEFFLHKWQN